MNSSINYSRGKILGSGTWGCVYESQSLITNKKVAIKRIEQRNDGLDFTALREVKYLQELKYGKYSNSIIQLLDIFVTSGAIHLVLEFCPTDLERIIRDNTISLSIDLIKSYSYMMISGLSHCHNHYILHRDLKPSNLLIRCNGELCLADFGLARSYGSALPMTNDVVTRWYKPPELLLGACFYSSVDIWSAGCILAELLYREPLFPGNTDLEQLSLIFNIFGTPNNDDWPNVNLLPNYIEFDNRDPIDVKNYLMNYNSNNSSSNTDSFGLAIDLMLSMLQLNPIKRISSNDSLEHKFLAAWSIDSCPLYLPK